MKKTKRAHKQSKFFTIMLVPDSSAKVRRMRMPYWTLVALGIPIIWTLIIVVLFQAQVINLESMLDNSNMRLSETIDEKDRLRETLHSAEPPPQEITLVEEPTPLGEQGYSSHASPSGETLEPYPRFPYEQKIAELLYKIETIDGMKHGIIQTFEDLAAMDIPFMFDGTTLSGGVIRAQGGAYVGGPEDVFAELEMILSNESIDMQALTVLAEDLEAYFRARPRGWPVEMRQVGSEFGYRTNPFTGLGLERHDGIDIMASMGTEVVATAYGVVAFAGWNDGGFGYLVIIEHDFDYSTYYAHNSELLVAEGDEVVRGQPIALSGNTGRSTAPHCHYEVRTNGIPIDPRGYLD